MTTMPLVDAVVVGSGPNGLVAANLLADAGWDVVVLEAQPTPGGAVRSAELTTGYVRDLCSAFYPFSRPPAPIAGLGLENVGLRWVHAPDVLTHILPDGRSVTLSRDVAATASSVDEFAQGDGDRWLRAYDDWLAVRDGLLRSLFSPFPPLRAPVGLLRAAGLGGLLRLGRRMVMPVDALVEELFAGQGARLLVAGCALHTDLPVGGAVSGGLGWLLAMLGQQHGFPVPAGGAGAITDALVARLARRGGVVVCDAPVDHIEVRAGAARVAHTIDGRQWRARRAMLADVSVVALYRQLLDASSVPVTLLEDLEHFRFDASTVKVDWALRRRVPWRPSGAAASGTVHLDLDLEGLRRCGVSLSEGSAPDRPFLVCGQMTTADPRRSPPGTESLWAYTHLPHRRQWTDDDIASVSEQMEETIERHAPGFRQSIVVRQVTGPAQFERENANLVGGSLAGGSSALHQQLFFRPVVGLGRADTPVDRLYLASSSAHPGGAVHGGPGANAAAAALARNSPARGAAYGALMRRLHRHLYGVPPDAWQDQA
jgi:phytoene dehydrogenase-like protein